MTSETQAASDPRPILDDLRSIRLPEDVLERSTLWIALYALKPFLFLALAVAAGQFDALWLSVPLACLALLAAQRHFQTLVHDASHYFYSKSAARNDRLANWLAAGWIGMDVAAYRKVHLKHHAHNGSKDDPEHVSLATVRQEGGLAWMILRYALGMESLRLVAKYFLKADAGKARSAIETQAKSATFKRFFALTHIFGCQLALLALLLAADCWWEYPLWLYLAVSWNPLLSRLRFLAEHPGEDDATVTTLATALENSYFAPQSFNFHCEHHGWPMIPPYRLSRMHRYLRDEARFYDQRGELISGSYIGKLIELAQEPGAYQPTVRQEA
ncbi:Fatty acid desaturase [Hartmannibacter diazotrophicus]|uniref:Fatty acid desaturase n=1 Tax=Hartmannibacter diazotrophicus TaxID=1482074 RepID=A0A2C9D2V5_9HYPH|nr:fatty acid desaturase [Hartmannibacter diazotrophicus]SON54594.1 Fatty acid desaturase [Hartmannibacter diazotrophicus]